MIELMKLVGTQAFRDRFENHALACLRDYVNDTSTPDGSPFFAASDVLDDKRIRNAIQNTTASSLFKSYEKKLTQPPPPPRIIVPPPFMQAGASQTRGRAAVKRKAATTARAPSTKKPKMSSSKPRAKKPKKPDV